MSVTPHGLHHYHKRKKKAQGLDQTLANTRTKRFMDRSIYFVGMLGPIMTTPQILKIWYEENASGISVVTWSAYTLVHLFWILYGMVHREKPIIFLNLASVCMNIVVILGAFLYR